jgi:DNA-binding SARP family transcriptional activator
MGAASHFYLFGEFRCHAAESHEPTLLAPRMQLLAAYLLLHRGRPLLRKHLAFQLWPDSSEAQAQTNLRNLLFQVRHTFPSVEHILNTTKLSVCWRDDDSSLYRLDVAEHERLLAQAAQFQERGEAAQEIAALQQAVALYAGDLLTGWYEDWVIAERERHRQQHLGALARLALVLRGAGRYDDAVQYAQQLVELEPLDEPAYAALMQLHGLCGNRAAALQLYQRLAANLMRELGVTPGPRAQELYTRLAWPDAAPGGQRPLRAAALVGRERERCALLEAWDRARAGLPNVVVVDGDYGVGKTRLLEELVSWLEGRPGLVSATQCSPGRQDLSFAALIAWLRRPGFQGALRRQSAATLGTIAQLLPELLEQCPALKQPQAPPCPWQQHLSDALARVVLAAPRPVVLIADDIHWCDRASLVWLDELLRANPHAQLLIVATVQSGELADQRLTDIAIAELCTRAESTRLALPALSLGETAALAAASLGWPLAAGEAAELYRETEGNPLFIVEQLSARYGPRGADPPPPGAPVTPRLAAILGARLAHLTPLARSVAGLVAAFGRSVCLADLQSVRGDIGEERLSEGLDELWRRRIVVETLPGIYTFSHVKLRGAAYDSLSPMLRQLYHRRIRARAGHAFAEALQRA